MKSFGSPSFTLEYHQLMNLSIVLDVQKKSTRRELRAKDSFIYLRSIVECFRSEKDFDIRSILLFLALVHVAQSFE